MLQGPAQKKLLQGPLNLNNHLMYTSRDWNWRCAALARVLGSDLPQDRWRAVDVSALRAESARIHAGSTVQPFLRKTRHSSLPCLFNCIQGITCGNCVLPDPLRTGVGCAVVGHAGRLRQSRSPVRGARPELQCAVDLAWRSDWADALFSRRRNGVWHLVPQQSCGDSVCAWELFH